MNTNVPLIAINKSAVQIVHPVLLKEIGPQSFRTNRMTYMFNHYQSVSPFKLGPYDVFVWLNLNSLCQRSLVCAFVTM